MMNHRMPSLMSGGLSGPPPLSVSNPGGGGGPMIDSNGVPMVMHPGQYGGGGLGSNMIQPHSGAPHLSQLHSSSAERELLLNSSHMGYNPHLHLHRQPSFIEAAAAAAAAGGLQGGGGPIMGPGPHLGPHMMHHGGHPGLQIYGRPPNPYLTSTDSRINEFNRRLQQRTDECDNIWWDTFITEFFEDDATLTITFTDEGPKRYTMGRTLIPRYFRSIFESGCTEYYYFLRSVRESFHTSTIVVDSESAQMVMTFQRSMPPTSITVEGRLVLDFTFDELMRIRNWNFQIRSHREFVLRSMPGFQCSQDMQQIRELFSINLTRCGIPNQTMNFFKISTILEPMQELMSRQKAYSLSPKDCLKTTLFQKWQRMVAPPGQQQKSESSRQTNKRRKRKGSSANSDTASGRSSKRKQSPVPSLPNLNQPGDVMIVGEPTLMGGEFGDEDERSITRLENTQYDTTSNSNNSGGVSHLVPNMSGPHLGLSQYQPLDQSQMSSKFENNNNNNNVGTADQLSSNLNGSLNNLLKSTESSRGQYPRTCSTPGSKSQHDQQQQQLSDDPQSFRTSTAGTAGGMMMVSKSGGPPRPTSQGANQSSAVCQDPLFGFTSENMSDFSEKVVSSVDTAGLREHPRPISEPLPTLTGLPVNSDNKMCGGGSSAAAVDHRE